jgi:predicted outer membrane repeat protein
MLRSLCLVALLAGPVLAGGQTLVVNSTLDLPDADAKDGVCDGDAEEPGQQITLRAAIMHLNALPGPDAIELPEGLFKLTIQGHDEDGGATGDLDVNGDLTITGAGRGLSIVDGKKAKDRVFDVVAGSEVIFTGFTIRRGSAPTKDIEDQRGGGIRNEGDLTLAGMVVEKCRTGDADGGGISHGNGTLLVTDTLFSKNKSGDDGGGVDISSGVGNFTASSFVGNSAKSHGGGLECSPGNSSLENCTFSGNKATASGGAVSVTGGSLIAVLNCTLAKNKAKVSGSGLFEATDDEADFIELSNCILANKKTTNYAGDGIVSVGGNLDSGTTCGFTGEDDQQDADPRLIKLSKFGEDLPVHRLKADSPCIDAGDDASRLPTDQLGQPRVDVPDVGTALCDIGAIEFQPEAGP